MYGISAIDTPENHGRTMGNLPYSDIPLAVPVSNPLSPACRFPPILAPSPDPPTPKHFPQIRQVSCFLPLENSPFSTLEPQTPCTRSACPQSRPVRASAPTPGWALPKPFQRCRTGNCIRPAHKNTVPHPLHTSRHSPSLEHGKQYTVLVL